MNAIRSRLLLVVLALLILGATLREKLSFTAAAQDQSSIQACNQLIAGLEDAIQECSDMNSNWACYGKADAGVSPVEYRFQALRDRRPLEVLDTINIFDQGSVLMNLEIEGQTAPIKTILFGPVQLRAQEADSASFLMRIDDQDLLCSATPPGIVIRTESGQAGQLTLNDVPIALKSAAFITMQGDSLMTVVNLEGEVTVTAGDVPQTVPPQYQVQVEIINGQTRFVGPPTPSPYFESALLQWLANDQNGLQSIGNTNAAQTDLACISRLEFGDTITEETTNPGHECLFQFCAEAGDVVTVDMEASNSSIDPWVDLRLPNKTLFAFNNDIDEQDTNSLLCNVQLPVSSCDYTIVARSHRNRSAGVFNLTLAKQTDCTPPESRCEVVSRFGVELHEGPGVEFSRIRDLPPETHMQPKQFSADGSWIEVEVASGSQVGWVRNDPQHVQCETSAEPGRSATPMPQYSSLRSKWGLPPEDTVPTAVVKQKEPKPTSPIAPPVLTVTIIPPVTTETVTATPDPQPTTPTPTDVVTTATPTATPTDAVITATPTATPDPQPTTPTPTDVVTQEPATSTPTPTDSIGSDTPTPPVPIVTP